MMMVMMRRGAKTIQKSKNEDKHKNKRNYDDGDDDGVVNDQLTCLHSEKCRSKALGPL